MTLQLSTKTIVKSLSVLAGLLVVLHIISLVADHEFGNRITSVMVEKFSMENEGNFPTYFSAFILFFAAVLFGIISKGLRLSKKPEWQYWSGLSLIFVFLSLDEAIQIHEKLDTDLIWSSFETYDLLAWPWVILYGALAMLIMIVYFKFWWDMPIKYRISFAVAALLYVGSALGFEMLEAREYTTNGGETLRYVVLTTIEECCEIIAIIYLISTNFKYITDYLPDLHISFAPANRLNPQ